MPHVRSRAFLRLLFSVVGLCFAISTVKAQVPRVNVALAANGGLATASSEYSSAYPAVSVNNGDHRGLNWGNGAAGTAPRQTLIPIGYRSNSMVARQ